MEEVRVVGTELISDDDNGIKVFRLNQNYAIEKFYCIINHQLSLS